MRSIANLPVIGLDGEVGAPAAHRRCRDGRDPTASDQTRETHRLLRQVCRANGGFDPEHGEPEPKSGSEPAPRAGFEQIAIAGIWDAAEVTKDYIHQMKLLLQLRFALALCAIVMATACGRATLPALPYPAVQSPSLLNQYLFALRAAEKRQTAYPDEPLWLRDEGGRSVDTALNADNAAMVFYGLSHGAGNEKITNEIVNTLAPMLQRYEVAFEKSQGKWYQEEYVETIGVQLAMLSAFQPKLSTLLPGPEKMVPTSLSKAVPAAASDNARQLLQYYKTSQAEAKSNILAKSTELANSERLKAPAKERLQVLLSRYR